MDYVQQEVPVQETKPDYQFEEDRSEELRGIEEPSPGADVESVTTLLRWILNGLKSPIRHRLLFWGIRSEKEI